MKTELLQQALDALIHHGTSYGNGKRPNEDAAIAALESALAQPQAVIVTLQSGKRVGVIDMPSLNTEDDFSHPDDSATADDAAVDAFAREMKAKLAKARAKGRTGWQQCSKEELSHLLHEHIEKGDPRDVANFCMFLHTLGHGIVQRDAINGSYVPLPDATTVELQNGKWVEVVNMPSLDVGNREPKK